MYFVDYKKYIPINDIDTFINGIENQLNLLIECEYNKKFCEMYEHTDRIIIPEVYYCTEKLMIMEYIKGDNFEIIDILGSGSIGQVYLIQNI